MENLHPAEALQKHLNAIVDAETDKSRDNAVPISCFPSMHATWGMFIVYYFARWRRKTLYFTVPWCILMLLGGLALGQHYLVDYMVAIPVMILCVWCAEKLMHRWGHIGTPLEVTTKSPSE